MSVLIVADSLRDWPYAISGAQVVAANTYLDDSAFAGERIAKVCNLCNSYQYQSIGYYVSLMADARGHHVLPSVGMIEDLKSANLVRLLARDTGELVQRTLQAVRSDLLELNIYFGRCDNADFDLLCRRLFELIKMPLLRVNFERRGRLWRILSARSISIRDIRPASQELVGRVLQDYVRGFHESRPSVEVPRYRLAVLVNPDDPEPPSNPEALRLFGEAALIEGIRMATIGPAEIDRLADFDGLFIRDTTFANHYTYRFARKAIAQGLAVIDDPDSILRCNNKVFIAELLERHRVPVPRTLIVQRGNLSRVIPELGLPCVLKQPDSSFSLGVVKVESEKELYTRAEEFLERSELIVAQQYLLTEFDWRVGILDRRLLFVCQYYMAKGHWQIIRRGEQSRKLEEGATVALPFSAVPEGMLELALTAANLIGDGFYGVDVKQAGDRFYVIEINDNPNVDATHEDGVLQDALYREVMGVFRSRMERQQRCRR